MEQPSNTCGKSQQYYNGLYDTDTGNQEVYSQTNVYKSGIEKINQNILTLYVTSLKQPSDTDEQSERCYDGLLAAWVNKSGLNPLAKEFIPRTKNNGENASVILGVNTLI